MKKILVYLKPYGGRMTVSFLVKILATMSELALPYILSYIIDKIIRPLEGQTDVDVRQDVAAEMLEAAGYLKAVDEIGAMNELQAVPAGIYPALQL